MIVVGIAGGSGSGKTTFSRLLAERLQRKNIVVLAQDNYYIDQSDRFDKDGGQVNFDHPHSIDWSLLIQHLKMMKMNAAIEMPVYDFSTHKRKSETIHVSPAPFVILDGILCFAVEALRPQIDFKIFIQTSEAVRFERRLRRDVVERGRTEEGVRAQIAAQVKPMHDEFVEPSSQYADLVISGEIDFSADIESVALRLLSLLKK